MKFFINIIIIAQGHLYNSKFYLLLWVANFYQIDKLIEKNWLNWGGDQ